MSDPRGYHDCAFQTLERELETDRKEGVSSAKAAEKLERDGLNELKKPKPPGLFILFVTQLLNVIMLLLIASACASMAIAASNFEEKGFVVFVEGRIRTSSAEM